MTAFTIRRASQDDAVALHRLAALDSASPPTGDMLVAEVHGELWAAIDLDSGAAIADPFRPSGELVDLLRYRADRFSSPTPATSRRLRLLPRAV
jgi:hypothetical protein